jgi:hypothetical protein
VPASATPDRKAPSVAPLKGVPATSTR